MSKCKRCHVDSDKLQSEQDLMRAIIRWLNSVTCIKWYAGHQDTRRPDEGNMLGPLDIRDPQYGVIKIENEDPYKSTKSAPYSYHEYENGLCKSFCEHRKADVSLWVTRQSGVAAGATYPKIDDEAAQSGMDVFNEIMRMYFHDDIAKKRAGENFHKPEFKIEEFSTINNDPTIQVQTTFEHRASMSFGVGYSRLITYPIEQLERVCIRLCDGEEVICGTTEPNCGD